MMAYHLIIMSSPIPKDETVSGPEQQPEPDPQQMEVHHHAHHEGKRVWKSYFWEFLMLFLAVTLGSYAENLREHNLHHKEVRSHINALITDLESDIALFDSVTTRNTYSVMLADSLVELLHSDLRNTREIYFAARSVTANNGYGYSNAKSFEQMKSSGLLRYIEPKGLLDSLGSYYASFQWLSNQTELMRLKMNEIHTANALVFDSYVFHEMMNVHLTSFSGGRTIINRPSGTPVLLSTDIRDINAVSLSYHYYATTTKFYKRTLTDLRARAHRLIEQIQRAYPKE